MNENKIKQHLEKILPFTKLEKGIVEGAINSVSLYGTEYSIIKWDNEKYKSYIRDTIKIFPLHCPDFVEEWASSTLASVLIDNANGKYLPEEHVLRFVQRMQHVLEKRHACIPLDGIQLRVSCVDFGFAVLYKNSEGLLPALIADVESHQSWQHRINALEHCEVYFQIELESDHENLKRTALLRAKYLCALLNVFVGSSQFRSGYKKTPWYKRITDAEVLRRRKIDIWAAESGESQIYYEFSRNRDKFTKTDYALQFNFILPGHDGADAIDESLRLLRNDQTKTTYHMIDDDVINEILSNDCNRLLTCVYGKSEVDRKLFSSVSWFGKAVNAESDEDQFLFFAIAIECLLVGDEKGPHSSQGSITQKISERAAFLISDEVGERIRTEAEIKNLYGIRSKIVHTGAAATYVDVIRIEKIARVLILKYAKMDFQSSEQFLEWITAKRYN